MRSSPHDGSHFTFLISVQGSRSQRIVLSDASGIGVSIEMNHCSVARKITGLWHRQQCGYECSSLFRVQQCAARLHQINDRLVRVPHPLARYSGSPLRRMPFSSTLLVASSPYFIPVTKSSAPWDGAVCTTPVPVSMVT